MHYITCTYRKKNLIARAQKSLAEDDTTSKKNNTSSSPLSGVTKIQPNPSAFTQSASPAVRAVPKKLPSRWGAIAAAVKDTG